MKLLSVSLPQHDANLSYLDDNTVRYIKLERPRQEKRFHLTCLPEWKAQAESVWGAHATAADDTVFSFDPGALPAPLRQELGAQALARIASGRSQAERLSPALCRYLGVARGWFISHHYSHALSSWMLGAAAAGTHVVIDGIGDGRPWSVYRDGRLLAAGDIGNGSIGWGMREAGKLLGLSYGHYNDIAGKVMGLQAYGRVDAGYLAWLQRFDFRHLRQLWSVKHWYAYRGDPVLGKLGHLDWIATVHARMGSMLLDFFRQAVRPGEQLTYSGGVAQNVVWNALLRAEFPDLVIAPHCSDEGLSLGALEWLRQQHGLAPLSMPAFPWAQSDQAVAPPSGATIALAARLLADGNIVGWYQGHGEIGPRALGNRSILMDPRMRQGKERINTVKRREQFRPFGASVLAEHFSSHFDGLGDRFMLGACRVKTGDFPAITHVDQSSRVQLVDDGNPLFQQLLAQFFALTGCPVLLNTSLNIAGKPIAARPEHAVQLFEESALDAMIIGDAVYRRGA